MLTPGERFAQALGCQDAGALRSVLAETVDFQALTPRRHWQASTGREVADEIVLGHWFGTGTDIVEVCSVTTGQVADCAHVAYRMRVRESGAEYLVEQQVYYRADGPQIAWMRILCSGYRPVRTEQAAAAADRGGRIAARGQSDRSVTLLRAGIATQGAPARAAGSA